MNHDQPMPKVVAIAGYLAIFMALMLPLSVMAVRSGAWQQGLGAYAAGCLGSTVLMILFVTLMLLPAFKAWRPSILGRALFALPGTLLLLSLTTSGDYPPIHDISTDTADPPLFVTAATERGPDANTLDIKPDFITAQLASYPDLGPQQLALSPQQAFGKALTTAQSLGWQVYHQDPDAGIIEAVDTTAIMGFKDDVVIRVRPAQDGSRIDLRSVSRVGLGDLGANAKRIQRFQEVLVTNAG